MTDTTDRAPAIRHDDTEYEHLLGVVLAQAMAVAQTAFDARIDEETGIETVRQFAYATRDLVRCIDKMPADQRDLPEWGQTPSEEIREEIAGLDRFGTMSGAEVHVAAGEAAARHCPPGGRRT